MADPVVISYFENSDGSGNATINKNDIDGTFTSLLYDSNGRIWCFQIVENGSDYDLVEYHSNDHGSTWSSEAVIESDVINGEVKALELGTGRIILFFWKDDSGTDTKYRGYTQDYGSTWTVETFTES